MTATEIAAALRAALRHCRLPVTGRRHARRAALVRREGDVCRVYVPRSLPMETATSIWVEVGEVADLMQLHAAQIDADTAHVRGWPGDGYLPWAESLGQDQPEVIIETFGGKMLDLNATMDRCPDCGEPRAWILVRPDEEEPGDPGFSAFSCPTCLWTWERPGVPTAATWGEAIASFLPPYLRTQVSIILANGGSNAA